MNEDEIKFRSWQDGWLIGNNFQGPSTNLSQ